MDITQLVSNHALKSEILAWREQRILEGGMTDSDTEFLSDMDDDDDDDDDDWHENGNGVFLCKVSADVMEQFACMQSGSSSRSEEERVDASAEVTSSHRRNRSNREQSGQRRTTTSTH